ncbi:helix-turn-helix domain-containing protein [Raineyella sp.]|nr:helix-turn-helix domain-containing protein [Raineyella sp.]MEA5155372.1 helix-turn-helix domain-containing protein [Raineyella sp.]
MGLKDDAHHGTGGHGVLGFPDFSRTASTAFVAHDIRATDEDHFVGSITARALGLVQLAQISSATHSVVRHRHHIEDTSSDHYKLSLQLSGRALLTQDDRTVCLRAGDFAVYDTAIPYQVSYPDPYVSVVLMVPKAMLPLTSRAVARVNGHSMHADGGLRTCLASFLSTTADELASIDPDEAEVLGETAVDLLGMTLRKQLGPERSTLAQQRLIDDLLRFIDDNLTDPELAPARIAHELHISLSHLHALFRAQGQTVAAHIRSRRPELCHRELLAGTRSITEIAHAHGFADGAHFSRVYKAKYGHSPRETRRGR